MNKINNDNVTVLGLGAMGTALAKVFLKNGHKTTVWNRSPEKADLLVAAGASKAASVTEALSASPLVIICLLDYDAVYETLDKADQKVLSDRIVVNLTNGTPRQAREMAAFVEKKEAEAYLDGGVMAVPSLIGTEHAFILYSGSKTGFELYESSFKELGGATFLSSEPGLASLVDIALLSGMYGMFGGFLQAAALAKSGGIPAEEFSSSLLIPWLKAMITVMPEMAKQIDTGNYATKESNLAMQAAGFRNILQTSKEQGIDTQLLDPFRVLMDQRIADGHGEDDIAGLIELIKNHPTHIMNPKI